MTFEIPYHNLQFHFEKFIKLIKVPMSTLNLKHSCCQNTTYCWESFFPSICLQYLSDLWNHLHCFAWFLEQLTTHALKFLHLKFI